MSVAFYLAVYSFFCLTFFSSLVSSHDNAVICGQSGCEGDCVVVQGTNQECLSNPTFIDHGFIFKHNSIGHDQHTNPDDTVITLEIYGNSTCEDTTLMCTHNYTVDYACSAFACGEELFHIFEYRESCNHNDHVHGDNDHDAAAATLSRWL